MTPSARLLSDAELLILKALWLDAPATVRSVLERLPESDWAYTTVQTLLQRLLEKGYVAAEKRGRALEYRPLVSQEDVVGRHLDDLARRICDGSPAPLLWNLMQRGKLSREDLSELRAMLDDLDGGDAR